ncbi:MAG: SH3 domain-containing protein [Syntrophaceae bacterium]|nr:SH3 domain-containing protein [Syntrophaceae bacterium]
MLKRNVIFLMIMLAISACSRPAANTPAPAATSTGAPTASAALPPTLTPIPTLTSTLTLTPSPTPFAPFNVTAMVDNLNIRTNPGYLFPVIRMYKQGTVFTVLGKAPGGEWFYVQAPENIEGWVFGMLLESDADLQAAPFSEPKDVQVIRGRVTDAQGTPIRGIGFAIVQGTGERPPRNDVVTDANGEFFAFMPVTASGEWVVSFTSIACKSNVWKDNNCSFYKDEYKGNVEPPTITIPLPHKELLVFTWK